MRKLAKLARDMYRCPFQAQFRILPVWCAGQPPEWVTATLFGTVVI